MAEGSPPISDGEKWRKLWAFFYASFLALWFTAVLAEIGGLYVRNELFAVAVGQQPHISDFVNHYAASKIAASESRFLAYDPELQRGWTNTLIAPLHIDKPFYFQYPPFAFVLFLPLSMFSIGCAFWVSGFASLVFGAGMLVILLRQVALLDRRSICLVILGCVSSVASCLCLRMGQLSWILVGLVAAYFGAIIKRRDLLAGGLLALTTIKFQYLPVLLAPAVAAVRWRVLIAAAVAETVLLIMGGLAVGFHNVFNYPQILAHAETTPDFTGVVTGKMVNLRGALALLVPVLPSFETSLAILAVGVIAAVWICRRGASHGDLGQRWSLALSIVVALVASPHVHIHDLLLLGNAAALTLPVIDLGAIVRQRHRSLALWCYLLILYPVIGWVFFLLQDLLASMRVQPFCLINLILFFSGYMYFHKHIDRPPSTAAP